MASRRFPAAFLLLMTVMAAAGYDMLCCPDGAFVAPEAFNFQHVVSKTLNHVSALTSLTNSAASALTNRWTCSHCPSFLGFSRVSEKIILPFKTSVSHTHFLWPNIRQLWHNLPWDSLEKATITCHVPAGLLAVWEASPLTALHTSMNLTPSPTKLTMTILFFFCAYSVIWSTFRQTGFWSGVSSRASGIFRFSMSLLTIDLLVTLLLCMEETSATYLCSAYAGGILICCWAIFEPAKGSSQNRSTKILQPTLQLPTNPRNGECFSDTGDVAKGSKPATAGSDDPVHAHVTEATSSKRMSKGARRRAARRAAKAGELEDVEAGWQKVQSGRKAGTAAKMPIITKVSTAGKGQSAIERKQPIESMPNTKFSGQAPLHHVGATIKAKMATPSQQHSTYNHSITHKTWGHLPTSPNMTAPLAEEWPALHVV